MGRFDVETYLFAKKYTDKTVEEQGGITVDPSISHTSKNPVENRVIAEELDKKVSAEVIDETLKFA